MNEFILIAIFSLDKEINTKCRKVLDYISDLIKQGNDCRALLLSKSLINVIFVIELLAIFPLLFLSLLVRFSHSHFEYLWLKS